MCGPHPPLPPQPAHQGGVQGPRGRAPPQPTAVTSRHPLPHHRRDVHGWKDRVWSSGQSSSSSVLAVGILYPAYASFKAVRAKSHRDYVRFVVTSSIRSALSMVL